MRVLFLTHRLPYAPNRGDRIRAFQLLREMSRFASVGLFSFAHDDEELAQVPRVPFADQVEAVRVQRLRNAARGAICLASQRPLTHVLLDAGPARSTLAALAARHPPDVVVAYCSGMARFALETPLADRPLVLDMVDVDSAKWADFAGAARPPRRWIYAREARTLRAFEERATRRAVATLVVNERERQTLLDIAPGAHVVALPIGIDLARYAPPSPPTADATVIFCGVMDYYPNEDGVRWFVESVWPIVRQARPDARFLVVGSRPTRAIRHLAAQDASIEVTGSVPEVQPYLWRAAVSVAPLRLARGLQTKVLEALAAGLPVVTTPAVIEGLPDIVRPGCEARETPDAFAAAVIDLLGRRPEERRQRAAAASMAALDWSTCLRPLQDILIAAAEGRPFRT